MSKLDESRTEATRDDYETPQKVLTRVREVFGGPITLDPFTKPSNPTKALITACLERGENGLHEWPADIARAHGLRLSAFSNPPYGKQLGPCNAHCAAQSRLGWDVITLTPGRPDTNWYDAHARACKYVAAIRGRLIFELDGAPVKSWNKKRQIWEVSPCQFPCVLGILTESSEVAERFADVMSRDGFARIERVAR